MDDLVFWIVISLADKNTYVFEYCRYRINALRASGMMRCGAVLFLDKGMGLFDSLISLDGTCLNTADTGSMRFARPV